MRKMQESKNTGVIYLITNQINNKKYVGKAFSYVKNGASGVVEHGVNGRFANHIKAARNDSVDCPLLYEDMRKYGTKTFSAMLLEVCLKTDLKEKEIEYITLLNTCDPSIGYNYFVGNKKPQDKHLYATYLQKKKDTNVNRAIDGSMKRKDHSKDLPPNINYRCTKNEHGEIKSEGYFVQIKLDGKLYNKAFLSLSLSIDEKLERAKEYLNNIKLTV